MVSHAYYYGTFTLHVNCMQEHDISFTDATQDIVNYASAVDGSVCVNRISYMNMYIVCYAVYFFNQRHW